MANKRIAFAALVLLSPVPLIGADYQHVLVIVADDLGSDKVGAYAVDVDNPSETRPSTPNIDLLAAAGVRFTDAWATPACSPTRAMVLTGEYPHRNGVGYIVSEGSATKLATSPDTLQQILSDAGIATGLFGKWHLGENAGTPDEATPSEDRKEYPINTGFEIFQGNTDGQVASYLDWLYISSVPDSAHSSGYATTATQNTTTTPTDQTTDDAVAWMEEKSAAGERRATFVNYHLPHYTFDADNNKIWSDAVTSCGGTPAGTEQENFRLATECFDDELAELISRTPDLEDTLVVFLGDNGTPDSLGEGNFDDGRGKFTVYESGVRVPLVIVDGLALQDTIDNGGALPGTGTYPISAGALVQDPASLVDLHATLLDLLAVTASGCTPGTDCARDSVTMRSVLTGGASARDHVWAEQIRRSSTGVSWGEGAVRVGDVKLRVSVEEASAPCREYELYDLADDRWETTDLYDDPAYADLQAELVTLLEEKVSVMSGSRHDWLDVEDCVVCEATETWYDGIDQACDGGDDYDQDGDTWQYDVDCDDLDPAVHPDATEAWYDDVDQNCDGLSDWDQDGDGSDSPADCDDTSPAVYPGATETWYDGVDQNCDGRDDYDRDSDGDRHRLHGGGDCNDSNPAVRSTATETWYDGIDQNCDGRSDYDRDADGYDSSAYGGTDCNDHRYRINPGAVEIPGDGVDQNCNGSDAS